MEAHFKSTWLFALLQVVDGLGELSSEEKGQINAGIAELVKLGAGKDYVSDPCLSGVWVLLYTTEKEVRFIVNNAKIFKRQVDYVYQSLDLSDGSLYNGILFERYKPGDAGASKDKSKDKQPEGEPEEMQSYFNVYGALKPAGPQRLQFRFNRACLKLGGDRLWLPPFGSGWFDVLYMDSQLRVARDSRGDTSVYLRQSDL